MLSSTYTIAAELYKKTGHKDSALHFYKELMKNGELYARTDAAWNLAQYALQDNKTKEANLYMKQYIAGIDTVWALNNTEKIRQLRSTYNYNLREQENNRLKWENKQKQIHLVGALSSIIILFVCFLAYIQYSQKKQVQMKLQLEKLKQLEEKQETENFILKEKNIEKWKYFQSTEICQYFFQCIEQKTYHIADEKWKELENILNITYDQFTEKLQDIHRLSIYEMRLCMLLKMNISPKDMAILTNHSKESVTSTRRRMYKKFFGVKGCPQDWDKFIKTL